MVLLVHYSENTTWVSLEHSKKRIEEKPGKKKKNKEKKSLRLIQITSTYPKGFPYSGIQFNMVD